MTETATEAATEKTEGVRKFQQTVLKNFADRYRHKSVAELQSEIGDLKRSAKEMTDAVQDNFALMPERDRLLLTAASLWLCTVVMGCVVDLQVDWSPQG